MLTYQGLAAKITSKMAEKPQPSPYTCVNNGDDITKSRPQEYYSNVNLTNHELAVEILRKFQRFEESESVLLLSTSGAAERNVLLWKALTGELP